jgi:uncharacterized protein (DUF1800 family)
MTAERTSGAKLRSRAGSPHPRAHATPGRLGWAGAALSASALAALLAVSTAFAAPRAASHAAGAKPTSDNIVLPKKFKGNLPVTELTEDQAILHALDRLAYGPRPGDVERVKQMGLEKWIDQQLDPDSIDDSAFDKRLARYPTLTMSSEQLLADFPPPAQAAKKEGITKDEYKRQMQQKRQESVAEMLPTGDGNFDRANVQLARLVGPNRIIAELAMAKMDRAVYSNRQLEAVMEDFWFNHFNVYANKGADKWLLSSYVRDTIRPHTMGKFSDLLLATAKSPAMLFYLDNWLSADSAAVKRIEEMRAMRQERYYMRFGTMPPGYGIENANGRPKQQDRGLNENYGREVMELHTVGVDAGYSQQDVIDMAEIMTGWTIRAPRKNAEFFFNDRIHAEEKETVMGHTFHGDGMNEGEKALEMLASDPHTAQHISLELAEYFVSDDPPAGLVDRMAHEFESSRGDITVVLRTMIYSPEFWSKQAYRAKIKTPFELVASTARALNADVEVTLPLVQWVGRMGEPLFQCQPPTGYSDKSEMWVNSGALLNRLNFALAFGRDHMAGAEVELKNMFGQDADTDPNVALTDALGIFLDGQVAPGTRKVLEKRLNDPRILQARLDDPIKHVNEGLIAGLVLGAPEFQRR